MTEHINAIRTLQTYNEVRLYLHYAIAKHPIELMEKNRLAAALAYLELTKDIHKVKGNITTIFDTTNLCDVVKLAMK